MLICLVTLSRKTAFRLKEVLTMDTKQINNVERDKSSTKLTQVRMHADVFRFPDTEEFLPINIYSASLYVRRSQSKKAIVLRDFVLAFNVIWNLSLT